MYHGIGIETSNSNIHGEFSKRSGQQRLSAVTVRITILLIRQKSLWNQCHAVGRYCRPSENVSRRFSWNYFAAITTVANKTDPPHTYSQTYAGTVYYPMTITGCLVICEVCRSHLRANYKCQSRSSRHWCTK